MVVPTPMPRPPGVDGLCPIMVDSVITVSVMVSIATSPMTGAASVDAHQFQFVQTTPSLIERAGQA